jgi:VanZ family protein
MQIANIFYSKFQWLFNCSDSKSELELILKINFFIRKIAHFGVFALLTVFMLFAAMKIPLSGVVRCSLIFLAAGTIAGADEFHQMFTGRNANLSDVLIDICGILFIYSIVGLSALFQSLYGKR